MAETPRTSFRFSNEEAAFAALLRNPDSDESAAVRELTGMESLSHAPAVTLIHVLIEAGMLSIAAKAEEVGNARLTEFLKTDSEHHAWHGRRQRPFRSLAEDAA